MRSNQVIPVQAATDVAEARRAAAAFSRAMALDTTVAGQVAIVVTEAASNLVKHGGGGSILLRQRDEDTPGTLEMLAIDKGPGMDNVGRFMADGYSTAGSPGNGLGAIARLSSFHEIYSSPGTGTVVLAHMRNAEPGERHASRRPGAAFEIGAVNVPKTGELECGDSWVTHQGERGIRAMLVDGLGHGTGAAAAANLAVEIAGNYPAESALHLLERVHNGLRPTRGAAAAVAEIDTLRDSVYFAGLGNVAGLVLSSPEVRRQMVSHSGTAGHHAARIRDFKYAWAPDSILVMHSDGLISHWSLERYPGLFRSHASIIAAVLYRDFQRGNDDVTVLVVRHTNSTGRSL